MLVKERLCCGTDAQLLAIMWIGSTGETLMGVRDSGDVVSVSEVDEYKDHMMLTRGSELPDSCVLGWAHGRARCHRSPDDQESMRSITGM